MGLGTGLGVYLPIVVYLACIVGTFVSMARPAIGIYLLALILPLTYARHRLFEYPFGDHTIELLLLGVLIGVLVNRQGVLNNIRGRNILLAMAVTSYVSLWIAPLLNDTVPWPVSFGDSPFAQWVLYMRIPLIFLLTYAAIDTKPRMQLLLLCMLVSFLWVGKGFRAQMASRDVSEFSNYLRNGADMGLGGANVLASFQVNSLAFLLGMFGVDKRWRIRVPVLAAMAMAGYGVLFSYSRGAYAGAALAVCYIAFFKVRWLVPIMLIGALNAPALLPKSVIDRVTMTYQETGGGEVELEASADLRIGVWRHALETTMRDPILGVGFDTYRYYRQGQQLKDTHNMYLRALVDTGIVGLLLLVSLWLTGLKAGHDLFRRAKDPFLRGMGLGFAAHMLGLMVANMFGDRWSYIEVSGWAMLLMGMVMRGHTLLQQEGQTEAVPVVHGPGIRVPMPEPAR